MSKHREIIQELYFTDLANHRYQFNGLSTTAPSYYDDFQQTETQNTNGQFSLNVYTVQEARLYFETDDDRSDFIEILDRFIGMDFITEKSDERGMIGVGDGWQPQQQKDGSLVIRVRLR